MLSRQRSGAKEPLPVWRSLGAQSRTRTRWFVNIVTILGFAIPLVAYFGLIGHYSVNVIYGDQWDDIRIIGHSYSGNLTLGTLWEQHNENRILFPNLIVLLLSRMTSFNIVFEQYLMGVMLVVASALLIWAHKRRSVGTPWIFYCPVAFVLLTFVQHGNTLWGFQMAWYLVMLMFAVTVFLIDRRSPTWPVFMGAIAAAVVGSFSSLQGLLIWPAGLVLLVFRRRPRPLLITWLAAAAVTFTIYFIGFNGDTATTRFGTFVALKHPIAALKFFFFAIGNFVGVEIPFNGVNVSFAGTGNTGVLALGIFLVVLAVLLIVFYGTGERESGGPVGIAMICYGLLFALMITQGRLWGGFWAASASRYTTFDVLVLAGIYLVVLDWPQGNWPLGRADVLKRDTHSRGRWPRLVVAARTLKIRRIAVSVVLALIALQVIVGTRNGIIGARGDHETRVMAARVLANIEREPDSLVAGVLYPFSPPKYIRPLAETAREHHLSLFADSKR